MFKKMVTLMELFLMGLFLTMPFTSYALSQSVILKGSDTILPVGQMLAEEYMKQSPKNIISVTGGGSGVGIAALVDGTCDIAMASRSPEDKEIAKAKEKGKELTQHIIGYDGIAVVVNPQNSISNLTTQQIADIYAGTVNNWKELGGSDLKIVVTSRESSSGTFTYFKEHVLKNKDYRADALLLPSTANIVGTVKQNKAAIGYVGLAYVKKEIKALKVSSEKGKPYISPSLKTVKDKSYPISRPLFFLTSGSLSESQKTFLGFVKSKKGQAIVQEIGYIPVN